MGYYKRAYAIVGLRVDSDLLAAYLQDNPDFCAAEGTLCGYVLLRRTEGDDYEFLSAAMLTDGEGSVEDNCQAFPTLTLVPMMKTIRDEMYLALRASGLWEEGRFGVHVMLYTFFEEDAE
jgi:hypothetical protein